MKPTIKYMMHDFKNHICSNLIFSIALCICPNIKFVLFHSTSAGKHMIIWESVFSIVAVLGFYLFCFLGNLFSQIGRNHNVHIIQMMNGASLSQIIGHYILEITLVTLLSVLMNTILSFLCVLNSEVSLFFRNMLIIVTSVISMAVVSINVYKKNRKVRQGGIRNWM